MYIHIYIYIYIYTHTERERERDSDREGIRERETAQGYKGTRVRCPHIAECSDLRVYFVKDNFKSKQTKKSIRADRKTQDHTQSKKR